MKTVQKIIKYILAYWFSLTIVPGFINNTNSFTDIMLASGGFAAVILIVPIVISFFKLPKKNPTANFLVSAIMVSVYTFLIKPGALGLIYFPHDIVLGNGKKESLFTFEVTEFGIIILIAMVSSFIVVILNQKTRRW